MELRTKILLFFLLFSSLSFPLQGTAIKRVSDKVDTYMKEYDITGIAVGIIGREDKKPFRRLLVKGTLSKQSAIPVNEYSEFRIGPLTELFTASLLAYFVQEGEVSLNAPLSTFLPRSVGPPHYFGKEITLKDLATHTSSLPHLPSQLFFGMKELLHFLKNYRLHHPPGSRYEHSELNYALLSKILSFISKRSFPDLVGYCLLGPLHLQDIHFALSAEQRRRTVTGYRQKKGVSPLESEKIYSPFIGSHGLYASAQSMLTFLSFQMGKEETSLNHILPIMQRPYHEEKDFQVALGWTITPFSKTQELFSTGGPFSGFWSYMGLVPKADIGIVVMANQSDLPLERFGQELLKLLETN